MDPFTQRILERTRQRREKLEHFSKEQDIRIPLSEKKDSSVFNHLNIVNNESSYSKNAEFYPDVDGSENRLSHELKEHEGSHTKSLEGYDNFMNDQRNRPHKFGRLAELATKIKEWEDEVHLPKQSAASSSSSSSSSSSGELKKLNEDKKSVKQVEKTSKFNKVNQEEKKNEKQVIWDKTVIKSLESQGYALSKNESRLIYDFKRGKEGKTDSPEPKKSSHERSDSEMTRTDEGAKKICGNSPRLNSENKDSAVLKKAAFFESHKSSPVKTVRDPVELSIAERKALFEKNPGEALLPKVSFATPLPTKLASASSNKPANDKKNERVRVISCIEKIQAPKSVGHDNPESSPKGLNKNIGEVEKCVKKQRELFEQGIAAGKTDDPALKAEVMSRQKELEALTNRWERNKKISEKESPRIPDPPPMPPSLVISPAKNLEVAQNDESHNVSGRLYPSLSEFEECEETDRSRTDSDSLNVSKNSNIYLNMSFSDILEAKKNDPTSSNEHSFDTELRESQVLQKMDEFLDNALDELSSTDDYVSEDDNVPSPPKMCRSSSFEYKSSNDDTPVNPLIHTVSFYRKQQNSVNNQTPNSVKSIKREEHVVEDEFMEEEQVLVEDKIQELLTEINKQQMIISQASQALNLCLSTVEFSGSGEQVESERLLLLANHKRQACLNEIQRLKVENSLRPKGSNRQITEKGDVVITNICIPLKRDALRAMAAVESVQYLVCLIKCDERVIATPAVPATRDNLKNLVLQFPGQYKLEKLLSDFKVTIEVYNLELNKELLPHEVKYHISSKKDKKLLTPIKSKKTDSKLIMPHIQSPAGPNAVRSSNFHMSGYIVFSLREVTRTNWTLNKVPYTSPLEGSFSMKIESQLQLDMEFRGFLTMFDDISGFGAWHRRWCLLSSHTLSYWKYPDDETRKVPIGTIDLRGVVTENVGLVSRDICARLFTFLLETTRPRLQDDKPSLVLHVQEDVTRIRHLLSADSKEEMLAWCRKLNTTLALLRSWRCNFNA